MTGTPDRILHYLQEHPTASAQELSRAFGLTAANIRYHLDGLVQNRRIEVAGRVPARGGRGRPTVLYCLADDGGEHNLDVLAGAFFTALVSQTQPVDQADLWQSIGRQIAAGQSVTPVDELPQRPLARLTNCIQRLNAMHYQAHWEAGPDGPRIYLDNCPYHALAHAHPAICQIDEAVLETLLGSPVERLPNHDGPKRLQHSDGSPGSIGLPRSPRSLRSRCVFRVLPARSPVPHRDAPQTSPGPGSTD